jgi:putative type I restriction enzyme specificity protein HI_0216
MTQEQKIFPYIARLLQGAEVVWTTLGDEKKIEIANANRRPVKASERISGNIPYYGANNIQDYVEGYTHEGTYILIAEDGTKSIENYSVQWATGKFWANNHVHVLRGKNNVDSRFIYYYLQTVNFVPFLTGGDRAKLTKAKLLEIQIPFPLFLYSKRLFVFWTSSPSWRRSWTAACGSMNTIAISYCPMKKMR